MAADRVQQLLLDLRDFRLRRAACDEIIAMGPDASAALLEAFENETQEGARWAIISCLGRLRCEAAIPAIAGCIEEPNYSTVAREALASIAGRDLGPLASEWLRWAERRSADGADGAGAAFEVANARLVELALDGTSATWQEEDANRFAVDLPLEGGRRQTVTVVFGSADREGAEIVIVYSDCGEARPEHYETALRRNLRMPYGAVALRDRGDEPRFVMFNTILRLALSPVELSKSIVAVGELADTFERQLAD